MNQKKRRIDPLYLESSECITRELPSTATYCDSVNSKPICESGILIVGSKSIIFEPSDYKRPIIKLLFSNSEEPVDIDPLDKSSIIIKVSRVIEIRTDGPPSPFIIIDPRDANSQSYSFKLKDHIESQKVAKWVKSLQDLRELEHLLEDPLYHITQLMIMQMDKIDFDRKQLESVNENFLISEYVLVQRVLPLTSIYGFIYLTDRNFYFSEILAQTSSLMTRVPIRMIQRVLKRRYELKYSAVEIETDSHSYYFNFKEQSFRDIFYDNLVKHVSANCMTEKSLSSFTAQWVNRQISNFEYILNLNFLAQRSFNDLSQYPVFPWVLTEFESDEIDLNDKSIYRDLSKPIGALNPKRLEKFIKRYNDYDDANKIMYGTHYSAPGYVVGFKFREFPLWMLQLQSGKFDLPDRLFQSIGQEWQNCYLLEGCIKELIPEFFMKNTSFLLNKLGLNLGLNFEKNRVQDVLLPKWARSADEFLRIHREALDSDYVSDNLHNWIDLIFGYKQTGEEAIRSNNVFLKSSYEGNIDLDLYQEPYERRAIRDQIKEFGQTPKQLFFDPHPKRNPTVGTLSKSIHLDFIPDFETPEEVKESLKIKEIKMKFNLYNKSAQLTRCGKMVMSQTSDDIFCFQEDSFVKVFNSETLESEHAFKISKSSVIYAEFVSTELITLAFQDRQLSLFNSSSGTTVQTFEAHDTSLKCLFFNKKSRLLFSSSIDCTIKSWEFLGSRFSNEENIVQEGQDFEPSVIGSCPEKVDQLILGDSNGNIKILEFQGYTYKILGRTYELEMSNEIFEFYESFKT